jgi:hypothetical protein
VTWKPSRAAFFLRNFNSLLAVSLLVVLRAFVDVLLTILQHAIDQSGKPVDHRRNGFGGAELGAHSEVLSSQVALAAEQRARCYAQGCCDWSGQDFGRDSCLSVKLELPFVIESRQVEKLLAGLWESVCTYQTACLSLAFLNPRKHMRCFQLESLRLAAGLLQKGVPV